MGFKKYLELDWGAQFSMCQSNRCLMFHSSLPELAAHEEELLASMIECVSLLRFYENVIYLHS